MHFDQITPVTPLFLRFYAKCFIYPYEEMNYELQHLFRVIEQNEFDEDELMHADQVLSVINSYQGEELKTLREDYVRLFIRWQDSDPLCSLLASEFLATFSKSYNPDPLTEKLWESGIPLNTDEPMDSIINYLEYLSVICEDISGEMEANISLSDLFEKHILNWIPAFCDILYKSAQVNFYREIALGLKNYLLWLKG